MCHDIGAFQACGSHFDKGLPRPLVPMDHVDYYREPLGEFTPSCLLPPLVAAVPCMCHI